MDQINVDQVPPSEAPVAQEVAPVVCNEPDAAITHVKSPEDPAAEALVENPIEAEKKAPEVLAELKKEEPPQPEPEAPPNESAALEGSGEPAQEAAPSAKEVPSDDVLVARLSEVLKTVDLGVTTGEIVSLYC